MMSGNNHAQQVVQKLWNCCSILRDDGPSYGDYVDLIQRDKVSLDLFWLRDESLEDSANLPDPDVIAAEIAEDLRAALEEFETILEDLTV